ncbi:MAG: urease subunit beta [Muribaculaceae bacterium]
MDTTKNNGTPQPTAPVVTDPGFTPAEYVPVGGVILADTPIEYNVNRTVRKIKVHNTGDRPIQVGSHYHFFEANRYLEFDRPQAFGFHLNIPATTAIRFEPGDEKEVEIVAYAGKRRVIGFDDLANGYTGTEDTPSYFPKRIEAFRRIKEYGYKSVSEDEADAEYTQNQTKD